MTLNIFSYRVIGGPRGMRKGGENMRHLLLCGKWLDTINTSEMVQGTLDTLTRVFDRVGLQKNVGNMVGIIFVSCHIVCT